MYVCICVLDAREWSSLYSIYRHWVWVLNDALLVGKAASPLELTSSCLLGAGWCRQSWPHEAGTGGLPCRWVELRGCWDCLAVGREEWKFELAHIYIHIMCTCTYMYTQCSRVYVTLLLNICYTSTTCMYMYVCIYIHVPHLERTDNYTYTSIYIHICIYI